MSKIEKPEKQSCPYKRKCLCDSSEVMSSGQCIYNKAIDEYEKYHEQELKKEREKRLSREELVSAIDNFIKDIYGCSFIKKGKIMLPTFEDIPLEKIADAIIEAQEIKEGK